MPLLGQLIEPHFVGDPFDRSLNFLRRDASRRVVTICCRDDADTTDF